jgi:hypothetical protein
METNIKSLYRNNSSGRVFQGDILKDVSFSVLSQEGREDITLNYAIVLSQDCDLEWDFETRKNKFRKDDDKFLQNILICPLYPYESFILGNKHITDSQRRIFKSSDDKKKLQRNNEFKRFHYLPEIEHIDLPSLIIDFKHYQTIPRDFLYSLDENRVTSLNELFREDVSQRFANFLSRIGLPVF